MAIAADVRKRVLEQYPTLAFLLNDPEIGKLLTEAVDFNKGYSPETFRAKLYQTRWWKTKSETQRNWLIKVKTDPAEANRLAQSYKVQMAQAAMAYGVRIPDSILTSMSRSGLSKGFDPTGPEMMYRFSLLAKKFGGEYGARRTASRSIQQQARRDYFYPMSNRNAAEWGDKIARGLATPDDVMVAVRSRAQQMFPQFSTGLAQGHTMADLTDGQRQTIAEELELDPEAIDFTQGRWSKVLGVPDKSGKVRPMNLFETRRLAREDSRFWNTTNGKALDAEMANNLSKTFGETA